MVTIYNNNNNVILICTNNDNVILYTNTDNIIIYTNNRNDILICTTNNNDNKKLEKHCIFPVLPFKSYLIIETGKIKLSESYIGCSLHASHTFLISFLTPMLYVIPALTRFFPHC